jgi:hypothetical protein
MRRLLIFFLICFLCTNSPAQILVKVKTDKLLYEYGEVVNITVMAINPTSILIGRWYGAPCIAYYRMDDFNLKYYTACIQVMTFISFPPNDTLFYHFTYPSSSQAPLSLGSHIVIGEILDYGISQSITITVNTVTTITGDNLYSDEFILNKNYPNPFNGITQIPFSIANPCVVKVDILNSLGTIVKTYHENYNTSGSYLLSIDLNNEPSGFYFCRMSVGNKSEIIKLILLE